MILSVLLLCRLECLPVCPSIQSMSSTSASFCLIPMRLAVQSQGVNKLDASCAFSLPQWLCLLFPFPLTSRPWLTLWMVPGLNGYPLLHLRSLCWSSLPLTLTHTPSFWIFICFYDQKGPYVLLQSSVMVPFRAWFLEPISACLKVIRRLLFLFTPTKVQPCLWEAREIFWAGCSPWPEVQIPILVLAPAP